MSIIASRVILTHGVKIMIFCFQMAVCDNPLTASPAPDLPRYLYRLLHPQKLSIYCGAVYLMHCTVCGVQCIVFTAMYRVRCVVWSVVFLLHCKVCHVQCIVFTVSNQSLQRIPSLPQSTLVKSSRQYNLFGYHTWDRGDLNRQPRCWEVRTLTTRPSN